MCDSQSVFVSDFAAINNVGKCVTPCVLKLFRLVFMNFTLFKGHVVLFYTVDARFCDCRV